MSEASLTSNTVLVVEDEPLLRMLLADALAAVGFDVDEAANSDQALELLSLKKDALAALITDIQMPGAMDGRALAWRIHELFPEAEILVVSGVTRPEPGELPGNARFLPKPVVPEQLALELRETLRPGADGR